MSVRAALCFLLIGCSSAPLFVDAGTDAGLLRDAGAEDAGVVDAGPPPPLPEYGTRTLYVGASTYWTSTGLYLAPGQSAVVSATGDWTEWVGSIPPHGPAGLGTNMVNGCTAGSLVASVDLAYQGKWTCIGANGTVTAALDGGGGILYLGQADYGLDDNGGGLMVTVTSDAGQAPTLDAGMLSVLPQVTAPMVELQSAHVLLALPTELVRKHEATTAATLALFDEWYERHAALAGATPYKGQRIRFVADARIRTIGAYMLSGNPIRFDPAVLDGAPPRENILKSSQPGYSVWGFVHEMGHDFTFINGGRYMIGTGPVEAWANVFSVQTLEALGSAEAMRMETCAGSAAYLATGDYSQFSGDPWLPLCMLLELKTQYTWSAFQTFFTQYNALADPGVVPGDTSADGVRWAWVRDRFNAITGQNTTPIFTKWKVPLQ